MPSVREIRFGSALNGVKSGLAWNASNIGVAAATFWFSGSAPRICSMVRTMLIWE